MLRTMNIKSEKSNASHAQGEASTQSNAAAARLIDLVERRRVPRALPRPDAIELDADTGWALWQQSMVAQATVAA